MAIYDADPGTTQVTASPNLVTYTKVMYLLHGVTIVIGIATSAFIVTAFLTGIPSIIAVIMNYARRSEARGTWLESHFTWQIRTFWFALLWMAIVMIVGAVLAIVLVGIAIWIVGLFVLGLWAIYRIAKGWLRLVDRRAVA